MPKRHDHLIEAIAAFDNLLEAARLALPGKRGRPGPANFQANLEKHLLRLHGQLRDGTWRPAGFRTFMVKDPKPRLISAAPFADRAVHHALCGDDLPPLQRRRGLPIGNLTSQFFANVYLDGLDHFAKEVLRALRQRYRRRHVDLNAVRQRVGAWVAHAAHADTRALRHALFRGGMFDPAVDA